MTDIDVEDGRPRIAIVGGGFSGAVVAHQLARRAPGAFCLMVIEPRPALGGGLAYSTADPAHRINVPASRMTFVPSDPCHFDRWLQADGALAADREAELPDGRSFPARAVFGRYVAATIEPYLLAGAIEHVEARAETVEPAAGSWRIGLSDGRPVAADIVVLAVAHPPPGLPRELGSFAGDPRLIADTQSKAAFDGVAPDARVAIVGTGLTMADIVASLDRRGHRGPIVAVSRRGLLSRGHARTAGEFGAFADPPSTTARALVRRIRGAVALAAAQGRPWQHVLDAARAQGGAIWANLNENERRQVALRLRPFWDVHRFRVAPQVETVIARLRAEGRLVVMTATPVTGDVRPDALALQVRPRGRDVVEQIEADVVALATGPAHGAICATSPALASLAAQGLVGPDALGLGLAVDAVSRAVRVDGSASDTLFVTGPLARGTFGELMGLPEVARHAERVAGEVLRAFDARRWLDQRTAA